MIPNKKKMLANKSHGFQALCFVLASVVNLGSWEGEFAASHSVLGCDQNLRV